MEEEGGSRDTEGEKKLIKYIRRRRKRKGGKFIKYMKRTNEDRRAGKALTIVIKKQYNKGKRNYGNSGKREVTIKEEERKRKNTKVNRKAKVKK